MLVGGGFTDVHKFDQDTLVQLKKLGLKVQKLVEFTDKLTIITGGRKTRIASGVFQAGSST